jgi:hypothetical protein
MEFLPVTPCQAPGKGFWSKPFSRTESLVDRQEAQSITIVSGQALGDMLT